MFKLKLVHKSDTSDNGEYLEHESTHKTLDEATDEANDIAFDNTGFNLENWKYVASFGDEGGLYYFYPVDGNRSIKYAIRIFRLFE
ncbi:hypothetical protein Hena1_00950 [Erwinia phage Hena1]|uniref:Uncharacterized protein n=1 Tax=Erwinia phage Hena1 TaxID=2678601 RepID=A0A6B9J5R3_9CAUD|nr:hypothetical protein HWC84_gp094 [Erwinia phage Hena1]QGZ16271.1 hypothetical protein Hena1_00950 [Erwinia phage Hena1]